MTVAYDGTDLAGWQIQPQDRSVQGMIEEALKIITKQAIRVIGSGRTDAGVHARGQVAHFRFSPLDHFKVCHSLNGLLPSSIRILEMAPAHPDFHAQLSAIGKEYHYHLCCSDIVLPFDRRYVWHFRHKIDIALLAEAARQFVGEHDFSAFSNAPGHGSHLKHYVRTLYRLDVIQEGKNVRLEFFGNGFLYKMVRNITGMLVAIAIGRRSIDDIQKVFASKDRRMAECAAPPEGLCLMRVVYPERLLSPS
jgi:tRNA pseudouridine38-40 synthase